MKLSAILGIGGVIIILLSISENIAMGWIAAGIMLLIMAIWLAIVTSGES